MLLGDVLVTGFLRYEKLFDIFFVLPLSSKFNNLNGIDETNGVGPSINERFFSTFFGPLSIVNKRQMKQVNTVCVQ